MGEPKVALLTLRPSCRRGLDSDRAQIRGHLHGLPDNLLQLPTFKLAQRPALDNPHHIADLGLALFVMCVELLALAHDPLVQRMRNAPRHFHHDGLGHLGRYHITDLFVLIANLSFAHCLFSSRSRSTVNMRARSLRSDRSFLSP